MKALIRHSGETVTENDGIVGIDWDTGAPLTNTSWCGGPYQLVDNYVEVADGAVYDVAVYPADDQDPVADTIVIDGVTYVRTS